MKRFESIIRVPGFNAAIPLAADMILKEFIARVTEIKPGLIRGIYLTGSIPLNDFHPYKSDIDFLILCNELPEDNTRVEIEKVHKEIERKFRVSRLSGSYITSHGLDLQHFHSIKTLSFHEGLLKESPYEMAAISLYELKTSAITLFGIPAHELTIPIEAKDVNRFLFENINTYWKNWIIKHSSLLRRQLLLIVFPALTEWVVLGAARQLFTLETGKITSKTNAGYYCLERLPANFHAILNEAIDIRNDESKHLVSIKSSYHIKPSMKRSVETLDIANCIIEIFNAEYLKRNLQAGFANCDRR
jgi:hypothetical protein